MQTLNGINIFNPEIFSFGAPASSKLVEKEINPVPVQTQRMSQNCFPTDDIDFEYEDEYEDEYEYADEDEDDFEEEDEYDDEDDFEDDDQIV